MGKAVSHDPVSSSFVSVLMTLFETLSDMFAKQSALRVLKIEQLTNLNKKIEENQITIEKLMALIETVNIKFGNRTLTTKKLSDENINGKKSEKKKGIDSSSKEKKPKDSKKSTSTSEEIKVEERQKCVDVDGTALTLEKKLKRSWAQSLQVKMANATSM
uniref:hypothetical protein n=1 Tax=Succinivibrio sp. TaxID=2053619 RepID=UPI00402A9AF4